MAVKSHIHKVRMELLVEMAKRHLNAVKVFYENNNRSEAIYYLDKATEYIEKIKGLIEGG